jgi:Domain of unknown function (DUF5666)
MAFRGLKAFRQKAHFALVIILFHFTGVVAHPQATAPAKPIGTIKTISGNAIVLASDAGPVFNITVQDDAKIVRIEPGARDLKSASPAQLQDLQAGDRILVLGKISDDSHSVIATSIILMKKEDVASKQARERQEWRNGIGGLVSAVDPAAGTITVSLQSFAGTKSVTIHVSKDTIVRRYAPDSVKFDDAKPSSLGDIKPGDQVRARGTRSADGTQLSAEEIVSGEFRNIAGLVSSVDTSTKTLTVNDLISKKAVPVKVTSESQLRKIPPEMAQFMAMRLKGVAAAANGATGERQLSGAGPSGHEGRPGGGGGDMQQMLSRLPPASLNDVQKGDAVMIVSTEGSGSGPVTAITLVAGVEPLLQASPNGGESMILPPWTLEAPSEDAAQ